MDKKEIDIYDFDKTIVPFDSGTLFCVYCMVHYPYCIITLPIILAGLLLMIFHVISFTSFKKTCFMFLPLIPKKRAVKKFWNKYGGKVNEWFINQKKEREYVVISASPDFLLEEINNRLHFDNLICTRHKPNGIIIGENCRDGEKVRRLYEKFDKDKIKVVDVYSDSITHDQPIFSLATGNCYNVVGDKIIRFDYEEKYGKQA